MTAKTRLTRLEDRANVRTGKDKTYILVESRGKYYDKDREVSPEELKEIQENRGDHLIIITCGYDYVPSGNDYHIPPSN